MVFKWDYAPGLNDVRGIGGQYYALNIWNPSTPKQSINWVKLAVQPTVTWLLALWLGLDAFWTAGAVILAALPTGALAFVVASKYRVYVERTSAVILGSTVLSVVTLSVVMVLFAGVRP